MSTARQRKTAKPGRKIAGILPAPAPLEVIRAADCLPSDIFVGGDQIGVNHGDTYSPSDLFSSPRVTGPARWVGGTGRTQDLPRRRLCNSDRRSSKFFCLREVYGNG